MIVHRGILQQIPNRALMATENLQRFRDRGALAVLRLALRWSLGRHVRRSALRRSALRIHRSSVAVPVRHTFRLERQCGNAPIALDGDNTIACLEQTSKD